MSTQTLATLLLLSTAGCLEPLDPVDTQIDESEIAIPACPAGTWCLEPTPAGDTVLHDVWAASATDAFAVGDNGTILRRQNDEWVAMASGTTQSLRGVYGTSSTNVWAVGLGGTVLHFDGTAWTAVSVTPNNIDAVWLANASEVWMCGGGTVWHSSNGGASFSSSSMTGALFAISGASTTEVYVTGENSYVRKWNGSSWSTVNPGAGTSTYFAVLAVAPGDVWVSDYTPTKETMHLSKSKWAAASTSSSVFQSLYKVSATDIWGVGAGGKVGHNVSGRWTSTTPFGTNVSLWSVSGAGGHVWTVGSNGTIGHYGY